MSSEKYNIAQDSVPMNPPPYSGSPPNMGFVVPGPSVVQSPTVVPAVIVTSNLGPRPSTITCRTCNRQVVTRVETAASTKTHLLAALLCILGCWPCACIPYCVDSCQSIEHYCPACGTFAGAYAN